MIALSSLGGVTNWIGIKLIFKRIPGVFFRWVVQLLNGINFDDVDDDYARSHGKQSKLWTVMTEGGGSNGNDTHCI